MPVIPAAGLTKTGQKAVQDHVSKPLSKVVTRGSQGLRVAMKAAPEHKVVMKVVQDRSRAANSQGIPGMTPGTKDGRDLSPVPGNRYHSSKAEIKAARELRGSPENSPGIRASPVMRGVLI